MGPEKQLRQEPPETLDSLCKGVVRSQLDRWHPASSETCCQPDQEGGASPQLPVRVTNVMDLHVWLGVFHSIAIQYCVCF